MRANCTVDIARGEATDEYGDVGEVPRLVETAVPAFLHEGTRRPDDVDRDAGVVRNVDALIRVPGGTDVRVDDRVTDSTNRTYVVRGVTVSALAMNELVIDAERI